MKLLWKLLIFIPELEIGVFVQRSHMHAVFLALRRGAIFRRLCGECFPAKDIPRYNLKYASTLRIC